METVAGSVAAACLDKCAELKHLFADGRRKAAVAALAAILLGSASAGETGELRLATTTSTENSGLLKALLPQFEARYPVKVRVIAVGTGKALKLGENGDADVLLVHAPAAELAFMAAGHGANRRKVMHNDFILVGPTEDPAGVRGISDVIEAFRRIARQQAKFISRGDNSGTDQMERSYWPLTGVEPVAPWYVSAGLGMGEVLTMAAELRAYTLTDRGTYAAYRARSGLQVLVAGDARLFNPYSVIPVNPAKYPDINFHDATLFADWITSPEGQQAIAAFRIEGERVFFPDAAGP
jgi:tungstate transport system substrate-binding protein